jgi:hypothetical protein
MRYHGMVSLVPSEMLSEIAQLAANCTNLDTALTDCIEQEALSLALEGNIVAKGRTGMTTADDESCLARFENDSDVGICRDGTGTEEYPWGMLRMHQKLVVLTGPRPAPTTRLARLSPSSQLFFASG